MRRPAPIAIVKLTTQEPAGAMVTEYLAEYSYTTPDDGSDSANLHVPARILNSPDINTRVNCYLWGSSSASAASLGIIRLAGRDGGLDHLLVNYVSDLPLEIHHAYKGQPIGTASLSFAGMVDRIEANDNGNLRLIAIDRGKLLDVALQPTSYTGDQANQELNGLAKPFALGQPKNVGPALIDEALLDYEINVNEGTTTTVYNQGVSVVFTGDSDAGQFRLSSPAATGEVITANVTHDPVGSTELLGTEDLLNGAGIDLVFRNDDVAPYGFRFEGDDSRVLQSTTNIGIVIDDDANAYLSVPGILERGMKYQVTLTVVSMTGSPTVHVAGMRTGQRQAKDEAEELITTTGVKTFDIVSEGSDLFIWKDSRTGSQGAINLIIGSISVRKYQATDAETLPGFFQYLGNLAGFSSDQVSAGGANRAKQGAGFLSSAGESFRGVDYRVGIYFGPGGTPTIRDAMDQLAASVAGYSYIGRDGRLRLNLLEPATNVPSITIHSRNISGKITRTLDLAPGLSTRLGVDRNWQPIPDPAGSIDEDVAETLRRDFRTIIESTDTEKLSPEYRGALARDITPTLLQTSGTTTQKRQDRITGLYAEPRYFYDITGVLDDVSQIEPGETIRITGDLYGLDYGHDVVCIGSRQISPVGPAQVFAWGGGGRWRTESTTLSADTETNNGGDASFPSISDALTFAIAFASDSWAAKGDVFDLFNHYDDSTGRVAFQVSIEENTADEPYLRVFCQTAAGATLVDLRCDFVAQGGLVGDGKMNTLVISLDIEGTANQRAYLNRRRIDWDQTETLTGSSTFADFDHWGWGDTGSNDNFTREISALYYRMTTSAATGYVDLDDERILAKFVDLHNRPRFAGDDLHFNLFPSDSGAVLVYCPDGNPRKNLGSGGSCSLVTGSEVETGLDSHLTPTMDTDHQDFIRHRPASWAFPTVNDYYQNTSPALSDTQRITLCFWIDASGETTGNAFGVNSNSGGTGKLEFRKFGANQWIFQARNAANTQVLSLGINNSDLIPASGVQAVLASVDLELGISHLWINDETAVRNADVLTQGESIGLGSATHIMVNKGIGIGSGGFASAICHVGMFPGVYYDFSIEANRRRFFDRYNRPVYGGYDGAIAGGQPAAIWLPNGDPRDNRGTIGSLTLSGSAPTLSATYPGET